MNTLVKHETALAEQIETVVVGGDLKSLTPQQRVAYYNRVCESVGLNPYTRPFEYLQLNGKLTLYARRDAADQLRGIHGISLSKPHIEYRDDLIIVTIDAVNRHGRTDADMGVVNCKGLQGEAKANAMMKAITKAKRRVTLSLAGLGWSDETEVESIPGAQRVTVDSTTGEILEPVKSPDVDFGMDNGRHENYPSTDAPTDEEHDILSTWQSPEDAKVWAVNTGACENEFEARNSFKKIVDANGGRLTKANAASVYLQFLRRQMEKLAEQSEVEPEVAF